jgi:hypothetical protein
MDDEIPESRWSKELHLLKMEGYNDWETYLKDIYQKKPDGKIYKK